MPIQAEIANAAQCTVSSGSEDPADNPADEVASNLADGVGDNAVEMVATSLPTLSLGHKQARTQTTMRAVNQERLCLSLHLRYWRESDLKKFSCFELNLFQN